jgi:hypothetical protein
MDAGRKNIFLLVGILVILLGTIIILSAWHNKVINALNQKRDLNRTTKDTFTSNGSSQYQYNDIKTGAMQFLNFILYWDVGNILNESVNKLLEIISNNDEYNINNSYVNTLTDIIENVTAIRRLSKKKKIRGNGKKIMFKVKKIIKKFSEIIISLYDNDIMVNQNDDEQTKIVNNLRRLISDTNTDTNGGKKRLKLLSFIITIMIIRNTRFSYIIEKILSLPVEELQIVADDKLLDEDEEALNKIHESGSTGETQPTARIAAHVSN